jgi:protein-S-isoprenylcysteine O-methyltransferase Ste14
MSLRTADPEVAAPSSRERVSYLVFGQVIPGSLYGVLSILVLRRLIASYEHIGSKASVFAIAAGPVRLALYLAFCTIPVGIYITRPMPKARDRSVPAVIVAIIGTNIMLFLGADSSSARPLFTISGAFVDSFDLLLAVATGVAVWGLLSLRNAFSIVPEARRVVRSGPYAFVRHPLYSSEIIASLSIVMIGDAPDGPAGPLPIPSLIWIVFVGLQITRSWFEERLLVGTLADYTDYRQRTGRFFPLHLAGRAD